MRHYYGMAVNEELLTVSRLFYLDNWWKRRESFNIVQIYQNMMRYFCNYDERKTFQILSLCKRQNVSKPRKKVQNQGKHSFGIRKTSTTVPVYLHQMFIYFPVDSRLLVATSLVSFEIER